MQDLKVLNPIRSENLPVISGINLVAEFVRFAAWMGTPRLERELKTQRELAQQIGVSQDTLTDWKNHPAFWPLVHQATMAWLKEKVPDIIGNLYEKAYSEKVSAGDVKLLLQLAGVIADPAKKAKNK